MSHDSLHDRPHSSLYHAIPVDQSLHSPSLAPPSSSLQSVASPAIPSARDELASLFRILTYATVLYALGFMLIVTGGVVVHVMGGVLAAVVVVCCLAMLLVNGAVAVDVPTETCLSAEAADDLLDRAASRRPRWARELWKAVVVNVDVCASVLLIAPLLAIVLQLPLTFHAGEQRLSEAPDVRWYQRFRQLLLASLHLLALSSAVTLAYRYVRRLRRWPFYALAVFLSLGTTVSLIMATVVGSLIYRGSALDSPAPMKALKELYTARYAALVALQTHFLADRFATSLYEKRMVQVKDAGDREHLDAAASRYSWLVPVFVGLLLQYGLVVWALWPVLMEYLLSLSLVQHLLTALYH
jgi:hypothetical protein